ncbi:MAG: alpha/beta hydrolase, partial [Bacteroidota bacterium]
MIAFSFFSHGQKTQTTYSNDAVLYGKETLPSGIRSRLIDNNNGCTLHILESGFETEGRPLIVLIHGFPELAYSWRKQLLPLAEAGYHVVAPDLRGYGKSSGTGAAFNDDLKPYTTMNNVADIVGLVYALGYKDVAAIVGHDYGSAVASNAALYRPDIFKSLVLMSVPYSGPPSFPFNTVNEPKEKQAIPNIPESLAQLSPPRKHYWWYYSTPNANDDIMNSGIALEDFFRSYFHFKSSAYKENQPFPISSLAPSELAKLPNGYIMDLDKNMAETIIAYMPSKLEKSNNTWLTDAELNVYASQYKLTGFQGGAQAYRLITNPTYSYGLKVFT